MFNPEGHEVDRVLRSSALSYFLTLTSEIPGSTTAIGQGKGSSETSQLVIEPVLINKDLQRFKWLLTALADLVFCRYSQSDLLIDGDEVIGFSKESVFLGSSSDKLKNDVLELAIAIRTKLMSKSGWKNLKDLNRKLFLSSIAQTVVNEVMNLEQTSNRVFLRVKLEHVYNSSRELKGVIEDLWNRTSSDNNQMDTQPWYTAWILQPMNERRIKADSFLRQAISENLQRFEISIGSNTQASTNAQMALIVQEACQLAEDSKDSIEILSAEFNTILAYEFDASGYLSTKEFIASFEEELVAQEFSIAGETEFSHVDETDFYFSLSDTREHRSTDS